jgi:hypothetical protein
MLIKSIYEEAQVCIEQIESLSKTRDTLLPKLMSGKIRVPIE